MACRLTAGCWRGIREEPVATAVAVAVASTDRVITGRREEGRPARSVAPIDAARARTRLSLRPACSFPSPNGWTTARRMPACLHAWHACRTDTVHTHLVVASEASSCLAHPSAQLQLGLGLGLCWEGIPRRGRRRRQPPQRRGRTGRQAAASQTDRRTVRLVIGKHQPHARSRQVDPGRDANRAQHRHS